jgi:hypothetical protein
MRFHGKTDAGIPDIVKKRFLRKDLTEAAVALECKKRGLLREGIRRRVANRPHVLLCFRSPYEQEQALKPGIFFPRSLANFNMCTLFSRGRLKG